MSTSAIIGPDRRVRDVVDIWYGDGPGAPRLPPTRVLELVGLPPDTPCCVTVGWMLERQDWFEHHPSSITVRTVMAGYGLSPAIATGGVVALPVRLSAVPAMIRAQPPHIAIVSGVRSGGGLRFGAAVGWADVLASHAERLVVEVDEAAADLGAPEIRGNIVAVETRGGETDESRRGRPADPLDLRIGVTVAELLPEDPTLQFGPGGVGEGIVSALAAPVRVVSGLVTDAMASLLCRGLLREPVVAAYAWGGTPIADLARAGMLRLTSATETHDTGRLSAIERFVACNTAIQVGLDGAVNVERVGERTIAGVGGHADFSLGASRSEGGLSIIAARSTGPDGSSTIVANVVTVSTPRSDIDVVVTEHGVADLRGASTAERARRLIAIASPDHRASLTEAIR